jgi:predicted transposase YdaD
VTQRSATPNEHTELVQRMVAIGLTVEQIARATGLPLGVVRELLAGRSWIRRS